MGKQMRTRRQRATGLVAMVVVGTIAVGACSSSKSKTSTKSSSTVQQRASNGLFPASAYNAPQDSGTAQSGGSLNFGLESTLASLAPGVVIQPSEMTVAAALYDPIVGFNDNGEPGSTGLATSWTNSPDLKTWTFKMRSGVKFTDGTPADANAVVTQIKALKAMPGCTCAANFTHIVSATAPDATTFVVTLDQASVAFPSALAAGPGYLAAPAAWAAGAASMMRAPIGSGPFKMLAGDKLAVVRNPGYWRKDAAGKALPRLDKINFTILSSSTTRISALTQGTVDMFQTADTSNLVQATRDPRLVVQPVTGSSSTVTVLNSHKPPFNDIRLRQAFNYALDRDALNAGYYSSSREPAFGPLAPSHPYFDKDGQLPGYDPAKAKALVAAVKKDGKPVDYVATCIATPEASAVYNIVKRLDAAVGINSTLKQVDQSELVSIILSGKGNFEQACFRTNPVGDPDDLYNSYYAKGGFNIAMLWNTTIDAALRQGRKSTDPKVRHEAYNIVQRELAKEVVVVPLLFDLYGNIHAKTVSGLSRPLPNSLGVIDPALLYRTAG